VECGRHPNIELLTLTELEEIQGGEGDFKVGLRKKPRYVDMDKCIACGECAVKCPKKKIPNEFNLGLDKRAAAYILYGQTVPLKYVLDKENCIYFKNGKCRACEKFCPAGAIDFDQQEEFLEINVGSVILAPGFKMHDPSSQDNLGYRDLPDVVTGLEYERLLSASGPCMGHLVRPSDKTEPRKIGWLQCVGSRNINKSDSPYCSSVCCMYAIKQALVTADHTSLDLDQSIFYMDIRTHGKEFEEYYNNAKNKGISFIRSRIHSILPGPEGKGALVSYISPEGEMKEELFDMFVLSTGMEAISGARDLADKLGIELNPFNFVQTSDFSPAASSRPGIYVSGTISGPKDIPQSVMEASAAACAATRVLHTARGSQVREVQRPEEIDVRGDALRIGVFVCSCGINIAGVVDVQDVLEYSRGLPGVVYAENNLFSCSQDTQDAMVEVIKKNSLNRIVVAACTPKTHEPLFQETLEAAGLNRYLFTMANIRNQDSWVHASDPHAATMKARDLVRMAVARAGQLTPLPDVRLGVNSRALVIGGGIAGMNTALELADQGIKTFLVEQKDQLGGNAKFLGTTARGENIRDYVQELDERVRSHADIDLHLETSITHVDGFVGNFKTTIKNSQKEETIEHGVSIIATGAREHTPTQYSYGQDQRIMTHLELDKALEERKVDPAKTRSVVFIQCVGSREEERPYCSRVCCTHTVKKALHFKEHNPDCRVFVLYRDMRTYGERELLFQEARRKGVIFIQFESERKPQVQTSDELQVLAHDPILGRDLIISADLLVLASAIVPGDNGNLARMFKLPLNNDHWFQEAHAKLRPVDFVTDGVFMAGMAHYPKPVEESIAQAQAAAARAITVLSRKELSLPGLVAVIDKTRCVSCGVCWSICPYSAISPDEHSHAEVNPALCKGCGLCMASCRSGAPSLGGFTQEVIMSQLEALTRV
jgi:heterodisulfide reductase subunit A2